MKAKRQLFKAMFTLMGMFILASCSEKSESTIPEPQPPVGTKSLKVSPSSLSFSAAGGTEQLQVTTTYKYFGYDIDAVLLCPVEQELLHPLEVSAWARNLRQEVKVLPDNLRIEVFN